MERHTRPISGVVVEGLDDVLVNLARCCGPVPGDPIMGFVTIGRGVSVHRTDCANIGSLEEQPERLIEVAWAPDQADSFLVWVQVEALDRPRLLRDVTSVLSDHGAKSFRRGLDMNRRSQGATAWRSFVTKLSCRIRHSSNGCSRICAEWMVCTRHTASYPEAVDDPHLH